MLSHALFQGAGRLLPTPRHTALGEPGRLCCWKGAPSGGSVSLSAWLSSRQMFHFIWDLQKIGQFFPLCLWGGPLGRADDKSGASGVSFWELVRMCRQDWSAQATAQDQGLVGSSLW